MNLNDAYKSLVEKISNRSLASISLFNSEHNDEAKKDSEEAIKEIFRNHAKDECFLHLEESGTTFSRSFHSLSLYLRGLYLLENGWREKLNDFNLLLDDFNFKTFNELNLSDELKKINYVWALASLYHDVVSDKERLGTTNPYSKLENNPFITPASFINFSEFFGSEKIRYTIFESYKDASQRGLSRAVGVGRKLFVFIIVLLTFGGW